MTLKATLFNNLPATQQVRIRCPTCRQRGTFDIVLQQDLQINNTNTIAGVRRCPDPNCHALLFFTMSQGVLLESFPPETIDFDATNIPASVRSAFEEAIKCHAQSCFVASAIMVRKTLEELCRDRSATGANLKERIKALGTKVVIPAELLDGLDDLRLLGNDALTLKVKSITRSGKKKLRLA